MNILYEDKDILVAEKPAGVPTESRRIGTADMVSLLKNYLAEKNPGRPPYLGLIHRLDQPVQGIIVFGKNSKAAAALSAQISQGTMEKIYRAVVCGILPEKGTLSDYLLKDGRTNTSRVVPKGTPGAKPGKLNYQRLEVIPGEELSLAEIHLLTGRHHQIRVQMAHAGAPLWGDNKYNPEFIQKPGYEPISLRAFHLSFLHPETGKPMNFTLE